jgi:hypothetical protein
MGVVKVLLYAFLTSAINEDVWSCSSFGRFSPEVRVPTRTHWTGGRVGNFIISIQFILIKKNREKRYISHLITISETGFCFEIMSRNAVDVTKQPHVISVFPK